MTDALAARVTALEAATQDTGWRNISGLLDPAAWTLAALQGRLLIKRVANTVYFEARLTLVAALASNQSVSMFAIPVGFQSATYATAAISYTGTVPVVAHTELSSSLLSVNPKAALAAGQTIALAGSWRTANAWPSTLPGTPAY